MPVVRWTLEDVSTSESYVFDINPNDATMPGIKKNIVFKATTAPGGKAIIFEGRDEVSQGSFTGTILSEEQYLDLESWVDRRHQMLLTDDLGRIFSIYLVSFQPKRVRRSGNFWLHTYSIEFFVIDWD